MRCAYVSLYFLSTYWGWEQMKVSRDEKEYRKHNQGTC